LREGAVAAAARGPAESRFVGRRVRNIQLGAVHADQPQAAQRASGQLVVGQRSDDAVKQRPQRCDAEALPRHA